MTLLRYKSSLPVNFKIIQKLRYDVPEATSLTSLTSLEHDPGQLYQGQVSSTGRPQDSHFCSGLAASTSGVNNSAVEICGATYQTQSRHRRWHHSHCQLPPADSSLQITTRPKIDGTSSTTAVDCVRITEVGDHRPVSRERYVVTPSPKGTGESLEEMI